MYNDLALEIVTQAVEDYKYLRRLDIQCDRIEGICQSELEDFFNSPWCEFLLQNIQITGKDILKWIK